MCILNHHAAHIYLCGDVRKTVYGKNIWNLYGQIYIPLSGTMEKYTNNMQNLCRLRHVPLSGKNIWIYAGRDTYHYPENFHTYVQPV